jgi:hypothetical protein
MTLRCTGSLPRSGAKGTAHPGMVTAQIVAFSFKTSAA